MAYIQKFLPMKLHKINILRTQLDIILSIAVMIAAQPTVRAQKDAQCLEKTTEVNG